MATVFIPVDSTKLAGELTIPQHAGGIILFAHGSGSSRFSSRNQFVARALEQHDLATLLIDLLTAQEEAVDRHTANLRFDIPMLADRLAGIIDWLKRNPSTSTLPVGLFGASTGGGAALMAAAARPADVAAVVSRGGRPDLAGDALGLVQAPTLLIVGGDDAPVIGMNKDAMRLMKNDVRLEIVRGATHLFEEAGALEHVADLAASWFENHLMPRKSSAVRVR